jgi:hypothetical protein
MSKGSLSIQITHGAFFLQPNSFLVIIMQLRIPETQLNSIPSSYLGRLTSRSRLYSRLDYCFILLYAAEHFLITTLT